MAAINNNPFEYYATLDEEPNYEVLMKAVQNFIDKPGDLDVKVSDVFTPEMFTALKEAMLAEGWTGIDKVERIWSEDLSSRRIIEGFLKDKVIGSKRLASMPDRFTNSIVCADGSVAYRPTVINNYQDDLPSTAAWFSKWFDFMFRTSVSIKNKAGQAEEKRVCALLQPISRAKYPSITEEEESVSVPLQVLALALFDAILVHMLVTSCSLPGGGSIDWHGIKLKLCDALVVNKHRIAARILEQPTYLNMDVVFLQEVASPFVEAFRQSQLLSERFMLLVPRNADFVRGQNSLLLVALDRLPPGLDPDCLEQLDVQGALSKDASMADGDLCAIIVPMVFGCNGGDGDKRSVILASFHGDTAGLQSTPVVDAVRQLAVARSLPVVFGLDANTHRCDNVDEAEMKKGQKKYILSFLEDIHRGSGPLDVSWQGTPQEWHTTFNARTFLQPQLNKAVRLEDRRTSKLTDNHPKDFILFSNSAFTLESPAAKDNTGCLEFIEGMDFPTLAFPSDHAIVRTAIQLRA